MANLSSRLPGVVVTPRPALRPSAPPVRPAPVPPHPAGPGLGGRVKAAADLALATLILVPGLPLMLACGLLVRLTSAGPAIYTQKRVGRGGRVFTLYKIRTMAHECESL